MNMDLISILVLMCIIALVLLGLMFLFSCIANSYVSKHKEELFDKTKPLSAKCKNNGLQLIGHLSTYLDYIDDLGLDQKYSCSSSVVSNASNNIIKYLIKYASIDHNEYCLSRIDFCSNWIQYYDITAADMHVLSRTIADNLPVFIRLFTSSRKLPYSVCDVSYKLTNVKKPVFIFSYVSPAGKSGRSCEIEISSDILMGIRSEIYAKVSKSGHSKAQRSAMTNDLREAIKKRNNYTCCSCGNSVFSEPNLLLEVDHIIPIAKGGKTEASNLQTLCWRCNRFKRDKL